MVQKKVNSRSALARELIKEGKLSPKAIAKRTGLTSQTIYTLKWKVANKQGLGAIKPQTPPAGAGTGITSVPRAKIPLEFEIIDRPKAKKKSNNRRQGQLNRWAREREEREMRDMMNANAYILKDYIREPIPPKQTMWQRIKGFFLGA